MKQIKTTTRKHLAGAAIAAAACGTISPGALAQDDCDPGFPVDPPEVLIFPECGTTVTVEKCICVPEFPPLADVVFAVDLTGSMSGEVTNLKAQITTIMNSLRANNPAVDLRFGLVSYEDYPGSYSSCDPVPYSANYGSPSKPDSAFRVDACIGTDDAGVQAAVGAMTLGSGGDGPQSYGRVFWESARSDSGIAYRPGALKILVNFGDNVPHDCDLNSGLTTTSLPGPKTGVDPGRDALVGTSDDIDFQDDALAAMIAGNVKLVAIHSDANPYSPPPTPTPASLAWQEWAASTGGSAAQIFWDGTVPGGLNLADLIQTLLDQATSIVDEVTFDVDPDCPLDITFDPSVIGPIDVSQGPVMIYMDETIVVPRDLCEEISCVVQILADGAVIGEQLVWVFPPPPVEPDVRTQGFWKRVCRKPHPSGEHENLPGYVGFVSSFVTFEDVMDVDDLCERLDPDPRSDKCEQAEAQFMALLLNVASGRLGCCNCVDDPALGVTTVGAAVMFIDDLLSSDDPFFEDCELAQAIADRINNGMTLTDCP